MIWDTVFSTLFLAAILRVSTPILLAAIGGMLSETAGVPNITLEGSMLAGAASGALVAGLSGNVWLGLTAAVAAGCLVGLLLGVFHLEFGADPIVVGIGLNLLVAGLSTFIVFSVLGDKSGTGSLGGNTLPEIQIPALAGVPFIGDVLLGQHILTYVAFIAWGVMAFVLARSRFGLHARAIGQNPLAAATAGVDVKRLQYTAVLITGALAGTAGAFLSMGYVSSFLRDMTAGRGFIAVAAIFLGGMRPLGGGVASLVFGFFAALSIRLGNADIPSQLVQAIPYLATLVGLGLFAWRESQRRQQFAVTEASRWDRLKRWRRGLTRV